MTAPQISFVKDDSDQFVSIALSLVYLFFQVESLQLILTYIFVVSLRQVGIFENSMKI